MAAQASTPSPAATIASPVPGQAFDHVAAHAREGQERLRSLLLGYGADQGLLVAYSGGVDSTYLLYEAHQVLGPRCQAAIALSESLAQAELDRARTLAADLGVTLHEVRTREMQDPLYVRNHADRCYFCKKALFVELEVLARELGVGLLAYGAMADDVGDHRPGAQAAREMAVRAPLQEAGLGKEAIRWLSREAGLSTWNLPAQACLASRFAYGQAIDTRWLRAIEEGEAYLRSLGFREVRVRHSERTARLEVTLDELPRLASPEVRERVLAKLRSLGYLYVTADLAGFRSGSGNLALSQPAEPPKAEADATHLEEARGS
jgi:pyridinium-3,5-biscarboxylic acid mononucleotide sulfurtransferase